MPVADVEDGRIVIRTQYHERHLIQQVPGSRYDKQTQCWSAPLSWATCVILRGLFGEDLQPGLHLANWSWDMYRLRIQPALELRDAMVLPDDDPIAQIIDTVETRTRGENAEAA